jgi:hypothetical protein
MSFQFSETALKEFIKKSFGDEFGTEAVHAATEVFNVSYPTVTKALEQNKVSRGKWNLSVEELERAFASDDIPVRDEQNLVPAKDNNYVPFGNFYDLKKIISTNIFYPVFITGESGNGKTFSVEQSCAQLKRELIRVNITIETDEDDLIGGFRLVDGATVWHNGPVVEALERGAILLLDEVDLASNKILCLQSILEGKGVFLKKTGRYVKPAKGFNIIATANTKGQGSEDGRFIGTNVMNEAFLERFALTFEQQYPTPTIEKKILEKLSDSLGLPEEDFCQKLSFWADHIRKTCAQGYGTDVISTRRLTHIIRAYAIFGKREKAITSCINRFDDETKESFLEFYTAIDEKVDAGIDVTFGESKNEETES